MSVTLKNISEKIGKLYRREILRDEFLLEAKRWFRDRGDETLRLDYNLDQNSVVIDVGGYEGDFAAEIHNKYGSTVHIFEPVPSFHARCEKRFAGNPKITSHCFGLSDKAGQFPISVSENGSSFLNRSDNQETIFAELRPVHDVLKSLGLSNVDLFKINIEGGEYEVLPACIKSGWISRIDNLQVQFHNFIENSDAKRDSIRSDLSKTHSEIWCYKYLWEGWKLRQ